MAAYHHAASIGARSMCAARLACLVWAIVCGVLVSPSMGDEQRRRIYFLESLAPTQPAAIRTIEAFQQRLGERTAESFEILIDYMELERFPGQAHIDRTVRFLAGKYAEAPPDLLIPLGRAAIPFMLRYRDVIAPGAPIIMANIPARAAAEAGALDRAVWVVTDYDFAKTLEFARRLQPKARQVAIVAGASEYDRLWADDARRELESYRDRYETKYLVGLPYDEMLRQASQLSPDTIVIMSFVFVDGGGLSRSPPDVAAALADVSGSPVYSPISTFFSRGIVGGYMDSFEAHGVAAADLALAILAGKSITALDRLNRPLHQYRADARQLERWGLSAKNLPPDTLVSFRQPTVWDEHRYLVIATALVLILQTGLVAALLVHRRRRRLAELELKESEERLVSTAASANVGLWQFDRETNEFWVTEHSRALFCLPDDAPLTRASLMSAVHPEDRAIAMSPLQAPADADQPAISDVRVLSPDGKARWIRIRTRSRPETRGSSRRLLGIFVDITEQKVAEAEAARQRQEIAHLTRVRDREGRVVTLNAMSASIAHEMSQPIGAMMASADAALLWLAKTPPDLRNVRASVERIASDGRRASDVIASMRSLLRRTGARLESIDVNDLIRDALAIEQGELQRQRILIKQALAQTVARVTCDRIQLQQVVVNLITNAIEAIGSVTDRPRILQVTSELDGAGDVGIAIEDSGPGIDRKIIDQLFEPFFTTKPHGMGLGLWICRQIVEGHGGRLTASSDLGRGSVFRIILPKGDRRRDATSDAQVG